MAGTGANQGTYSIVITADATPAERALGQLAASSGATGTALENAGSKVHNLGDALGGTKTALTEADRAADKAAQRFGSIGRTVETSALNGGLSGFNSALAGIATQGGPAGIAIGSVAVAMGIVYKIAEKASTAFVDQSLALEKAARAAGQLTPEIQKNADAARQYQAAQQHASDEMADSWARLGKDALPVVTWLSNAIATLIEGFVEIAQGVGWVVEKFAEFTHIAGLFDTSTAGAAKTTAELTRELEAQAAAIEKVKQAQKDEIAFAQQFAQDELAAAQADLSVEQQRVDWAQKVADAEKKKADDIKAAKKAVADAQQNLTDVETSSAQAIAAAKSRVLDAERRLRDDSKRDEQSARTVADAKLRLARVEQDIASGKLSGVDATRAYEDATTNLARAQSDQATKEGERQQRITDDSKAVADAKKAEHDTEVKAAADIRRANDAVRKSVDDLRKAQHEEGITALERRKHELDLQAAILAQSIAHQRLATDIATVKANINAGLWTWQRFKDLLDALHVSTFPNILDDLNKINAAVSDPAMPDLVHTADNSVHGRGTRPGASAASVGTGSTGSSTASSRGGDVHVHVNLNAGNGVVVIDKAGHRAITDAVHTGLLAKQASGQNLGLTGRR